MLISINEKWLHDGELCVRGTADGEAFAAVFVNTDIDYGWRELCYLPHYRSELGFTEEQDELSDHLWEQFDRDALIAEVLKSHSA